MNFKLIRVKLHFIQVKQQLLLGESALRSLSHM